MKTAVGQKHSWEGKGTKRERTGNRSIQICVFLFRALFIRHTVSAINKNLAIANRSRVSCAHNTLRASIGINITP